MPECSLIRRPRLHSIVREFSTGATRDDEGTKPDYRGFLSPLALRRFGQYMNEHRVQADGTLRASDNWKKGIPQKEYLSSLLRHAVALWYEIEYVRVEPKPKHIEDLLCAIFFNAQGLLHERLLGRDVGSVEAEVDMSPTSFEAWQKGMFPKCRLDCTLCWDTYILYCGPGPGVPK